MLQKTQRQALAENQGSRLKVWARLAQTLAEPMSVKSALGVFTAPVTDDGVQAWLEETTPKSVHHSGRCVITSLGADEQRMTLLVEWLPEWEANLVKNQVSWRKAWINPHAFPKVPEMYIGHLDPEPTPDHSNRSVRIYVHGPRPVSFDWDSPLRAAQRDVFKARLAKAQEVFAEVTVISNALLGASQDGLAAAEELGITTELVMPCKGMDKFWVNPEDKQRLQDFVTAAATSGYASEAYAGSQSYTRAISLALNRADYALVAPGPYMEIVRREARNKSVTVTML